MKLPASVCDKLDKLNKDFLWGTTQPKTEINLVKSKQVCLPKKNGGLSLKNTINMNSTLLAKANWRLLQKNGLSAKTMTVKYLKGNVGRSFGGNKFPTSSTWKGFVEDANLRWLETEAWEWQNGKLLA